MGFDNVWATVSWFSNPGIHSVIEGVSAFTGPSSLAYDVTLQNLSPNRRSLYCDRTQWLNDYAHNQSTLLKKFSKESH